MAQSKGTKGKGGKKGFGSMDESRQKEIASQGGRASAQSNTSNRGFASMDKNKQRAISSQGGKASQGTVSRSNQKTGSSGGDEKRHDRYGIKGDADRSERELNSLLEEDKVVSSMEEASYSETDEDENEGLGDGNIGRSKASPGSDEEG